jgi:excisionase family DNA binding protein
MNKKEVSEFLGVSTRLVERYASEGRLGEITYVRGKTGKQADYNRDAVEKLKQTLESPDTAIATKTPDARLFAASLIEAITNREEVRSASVRVSEKLLLSVKDCRLLTGLSEQTIRDAIRDETLKSRRIGRGFKVKRTDLDEFINKL